MTKTSNITARVKSWFAYVRGSISRVELAVLLAIIVVAGGAFVFLELAGEVTEGDTAALDRRLLLALRNPSDMTSPLGPLWLQEVMRDFTALGGFAILTLLTIAVVVFLLLQGKRQGAYLTVFVIVGGAVIMVLLKDLYARPRPDLVPHGSYVQMTSFPSGHSMLSAAVYLTLGAMLASYQEDRRLKYYLLAVAVTLTVLVGVSRVYLGVHWPTDVLAGWTVGAVWASLCWLLARWMQERSQATKDK